MPYHPPKSLNKIACQHLSKEESENYWLATFVDVAICVNESAFSIRFAILPVTFVDCAVRPSGEMNESMEVID